jgi:Cu/Ag efflux protein CusF
MKIVSLILVVIAAFFAEVNVSGQTTSIGSDNAAKTSKVYQLVGEIVSLDTTASQVSIKSKESEPIALSLDATTDYKRVPPGETTLSKAVAVTLADIAVGDQVYARGMTSDSGSRLPVRQLVIMSKVDIARKHEQERAEWRKRGIAGSIKAINPATKEITLMARAAEGTRPITIAVGDAIRYRRYAPESVKFSSAQPSSFTELKVGDQVRALGDKSADGTRFTAEEIVSGTFRTQVVTITEVNAETAEIKTTDLSTKQPVTIVTKEESLVRRISPELIALLVPKKVPPAQGGAQAAATPAPAPNKKVDVEEELEKLQAVPISELKPGEMVMVTSTIGKDASRLTAIALIGGIDPLVKALQGNAPPSPRNELNTALGLPSSLSSISIGLP